MPSLTGARAYQASARHRSQREQDADVFRRANAALRAAGGDSMAQTRALADNRRLWTLVVDLARDSSNPLPALFRGKLVSVGLAVSREMDAPMPDLGFLVQVNEHVAAGLSGPAQ